MKNRIPCYILALLCPLLWGLFACSEDRTAGGTVDGNSIAEYTIPEHPLDSLKVFKDALPASNDHGKLDTTIYWYEIHFNGEWEQYLTTVDGTCFINIYRPEYGVQMAGSAWSENSYYYYGFFLTAGNDGVVYHEKIFNNYGSKDLCEKDLADIEKSCETKGWDLYRHYVECQDAREVRLTCSSPEEPLTENPDDILERYAEDMKQKCQDYK